ncbi:MAG: GAF domain-containing sensor histidine kinase [Armatimonadetes bacterium]|nr:GAF domain-containing sensor histidine kinase [Armatimonadota bacterium]MDW8121146.1 GAF domain-containing sensor histidine kinase [Armatimonadota bacterium]
MTEVSVLLEQRNRQLEAIFRITSALYRRARGPFTAQELDEMLKETLRVGLEVVNADAGTLYLYNPDRDTLVFKYVIGEKADELTGMEIPASKGVAGEVFRTGEPKISADVRREAAHMREVGEKIGYITRNMITVPLKDVDGNSLGVLQALNKRDSDFDEHDMEVLAVMGVSAATALEMMRLQEERRLATIARLLGNISHDLKNLLTPVLTTAMTLSLLYQPVKEGLSRLTEDQGVIPPELAQDIETFDGFFKEAMEMIQDSSTHIQERVREIADAVKGVIAPPHFEPTDLRELSGKVLHHLKPVADREGVTLRLEADEKMPLVPADAKRLYNALYNLVNNAIPETPAGGSVTIRLAFKEGESFPDDGYAKIEVADTGKGIPPEVKAVLFTDKAISTKPGGTGLGTRIVKNVVDVHKGRILVDSEVGVGTTITILLPLQQPSANNKADT